MTADGVNDIQSTTLNSNPIINTYPGDDLLFTAGSTELTTGGIGAGMIGDDSGSNEPIIYTYSCTFTEWSYIPDPEIIFTYPDIEFSELITSTDSETENNLDAPLIDNNTEQPFLDSDNPTEISGFTGEEDTDYLILPEDVSEDPNTPLVSDYTSDTTLTDDSVNGDLLETDYDGFTTDPLPDGTDPDTNTEYLYTDDAGNIPEIFLTDDTGQSISDPGDLSETAGLPEEETIASLILPEEIAEDPTGNAIEEDYIPDMELTDNSLNDTPAATETGTENYTEYTPELYGTGTEGLVPTAVYYLSPVITEKPIFAERHSTIEGETNLISNEPSYTESYGYISAKALPETTGNSSFADTQADLDISTWQGDTTGINNTGEPASKGTDNAMFDLADTASVAEPPAKTEGLGNGDSSTKLSLLQKKNMSISCTDEEL